MPYTRSLLPDRSPEETDREFVCRIIEGYRNGYMNILCVQCPSIFDQFCSLPFPTIGERLYNWLYPDTDPTCIVCSAICKFKQLSYGYHKYCSASCRAKDKHSHKNGLTPGAVSKRAQWRNNRTQAEINQQSEKQHATVIARHGTGFWRNVNEQSQLAFAKKRSPELNDKCWLEHQHLVLGKSLQLIAHELNTTWELVHGAVIRMQIPQQYHTRSSVAELQVVEFIQSLGASCILHDRTICDGKEIDIVIPEANLAIEYCGLYWHSSANPRMTRTYHNDKRVACLSKGIKLITLFEDEWQLISHIVRARIQNALHVQGTRIFARKCTIVDVSSADAKAFFEANHTQGNRAASVRYGLRYKDKLVAVMTFGKSRYDKVHATEMIRYATDTNIAVVGGGSKLFTHYVRNHAPSCVVSYSDNRWGQGNFYNVLGFCKVQETPPSYWYFKPGSLQRFHRSAFMKHKVINMGGDPQKTEVENMHNFGYFRIWDCGTTKWIWNNTSHDTTIAA